MNKFYLIIFPVVIVVFILGTIIFFMIDRTSAPESEISKASAEFKEEAFLIKRIERASRR